MRLEDKVAIVTGGGRGIGEGIARMFAKEGAKVTVAARTVEAIEQVAQDIREEGGEAIAVPTDVSQSEAVQRMVERTVEHFGALHVLVNNAGIGNFGREVDQAAEEEYDRVLDTNLKGVWMGCHYAVPEMKKQGGGSIISIASVHGVAGSPRQSAYAMSKGGIIAGTRSLAVELAPFNIRVNVISPGAIEVREPLSWLVERLGEAYREPFMKRFGDRIAQARVQFQPLRIIGQPEDIAYCAVYLASDESRFVTGANFVVDGGLTARMAEFTGVPPEDRDRTQSLRQEIHQWIEEMEKQNRET